ncbi:MAG TPA: hypothetical protein VMU66_05580, partial [Gaiellales bacterium]|nr:hypothetical protein [Gaiellales bacterium]
MRPSIEQAVDLLVQREEVRLHSENSVTIALSGLRRLDGDTFTGRGPRIRLSLEQPWHARLLIGELVFTIDIAIAGCTVGEICSTVTATATGVVEAPVRRA